MAIDRHKIIDEMSKMRVVGNEEGLIPSLGVYPLWAYTCSRCPPTLE